MNRPHPATVAGTGTGTPLPFDMTLEVVVIPVTDVDRAKNFYARLGWRLDADKANAGTFRLVQFTPPGSGCSVQFGTGLTSAAPGSAQGLHVIVSDAQAAQDHLVQRGIPAGVLFHCASGFACRFPGQGAPLPGPHPDRATYGSFFTFEDPDHNGWVVQEVTTRLPGRVDPDSVTFNTPQALSEALQRASAHAGPPREADGAGWADRYAAYLVGEHAGRPGGE